jgi:hypothetical protein
MNYTREEAEEMASKDIKSGYEGIDYIHERHGYVIGRMSLAEECKTLEAENERLREALEKIADPLKFILDASKKEGMQVNVMAALHMSDSSGFLKEIAEKALNPTKL